MALIPKTRLGFMLITGSPLRLEPANPNFAVEIPASGLTTIAFIAQ
uniref:Uncharacterized protein n=1 Tax=Rhizophora mucronata TaxID=61149 RepID=A0A2P2L0F0_RHIMU